MTMDRAKMEISPPRDRFNLILFTFILHGVGTLMPWNMFITAKAVSIYTFCWRVCGFKIISKLP